MLIVQGGPGTGKTAVALHRAAYLLFEHRARLARDGVLVVGPNRAFLDYIGNVLPSLGERSVRQATIDELCIPRVEVSGVDEPAGARWKGAAERLDDLERAALAAIVAPDEDVRVPIGARIHVFTAAEVAAWLATAKRGTSPINERRARLTAMAKRELLRRTGKDEDWSSAAPLKAAINKAWPTQQPIKLVDRLLAGPRGKRRVWTRADQLLVDEANSLLNGTPFTYGHVVVDEAQDHSAVALRVVGRRSPASSMTLVGDVAQSTAPAGQERWADVFANLSPDVAAAGTIVDLTIGYRVPEPILGVANRLLPLTDVDAAASRSVRIEGHAPRWTRCALGDLAATVADTTRSLKVRHRLTGIVAPARLHAALFAALAEARFAGVDHVHELSADEIPIFEPEAVKGLEFDGVVVVNPHEILSAGVEAGSTETHTPRGARLLYVAMTRAVQDVEFVTDAAPPAVIAPRS